MFLDVLRRRNPRLIEQAIALHQAGRIPANSYVIDLDAVEANARGIARGGEAPWAQGLRHDQADGPQRRLLRGAHRAAASASSVDRRHGMRPGLTQRAGLAIGHIGHLVQIPKAETEAAASLAPDYWTVFNVEKASEAAAAAREARTRAGHAGAHPDRGRHASIAAMRAASRPSDVVAVADRSTRLDGAAFAGITTFPALLFDPASRKIVPTPNLGTLEQGGGGARQDRPQRDRDQRARDDLVDDARGARRGRRDAGRAGPRPDRDDAAARRRGPAGTAGGGLCQRGLASPWRRRLLLRRRALHRPDLPRLRRQGDRRARADDGSARRSAASRFRRRRRSTITA